MSQIKSLSQLTEQLHQERRSVSFDSYDLSIRQLVEMFDSGDLVIPPQYQRKFVWDEVRESQLIESIFLGIPVPSLFMATNADATWEVVDGVQRLSTIAHFLGEQSQLSKIDRALPLKIQGLDKLDAMNGVTFSGLPKTLQLMFHTRPLRVTVLNDKSDDKLRFDLFERLNTGGVMLTSQEIRNCVFRGPYNDELKLLAAEPTFMQAAIVKPRDEKNGTREEFALRFFAFLNAYTEFDHSVVEFLNEYLEKVQHAGVPSGQRALFMDTFAIIAEAFPAGIYRHNRKITPVNLFEAISVGLALALLNAGPHAIDRAKLASLADDNNLRRLTSAGTNSRRMVVGRIEYVRDALL